MTERPPVGPDFRAPTPDTSAEAAHQRSLGVADYHDVIADQAQRSRSRIWVVIAAIVAIFALLAVSGLVWWQRDKEDPTATAAPTSSTLPSSEPTTPDPSSAEPSPTAPTSPQQPSNQPQTPPADTQDVVPPQSEPQTQQPLPPQQGPTQPPAPSQPAPSGGSDVPVPRNETVRIGDYEVSVEEYDRDVTHEIYQETGIRPKNDRYSQITVSVRYVGAAQYGFPLVDLALGVLKGSQEYDFRDCAAGVARTDVMSPLSSGTLRSYRLCLDLPTAAGDDKLGYARQRTDVAGDGRRLFTLP